MQRRYYATIVKVYILSVNEYPTDEIDLEKLETDPNYVIKKMTAADTLVITPKAMAEQLKRAGSTPAMFGLDAAGNELRLETD